MRMFSNFIWRDTMKLNFILYYIILYLYFIYYINKFYIVGSSRI